jgi:type II secretory pathway pseudopilin PulG
VSARDRIILVVIAVVGLVAGAWMLLIKPERTKAQSLGAQVQTLQSQLTTAQGQVSAGLAARAQFAADYAELARLGEALPTDDEVPSLIYQLQSAATAAKVDFRTLQMSTSAASTPTPAPTSSTSTSAASGTSNTATPASTTPPPPGASTGAAGLPTEQFTFQFVGSFFHLSGFFKRLQAFVVANNSHITVSGRLLTVNAVSLAAGPKGFPQIAATVSATTYMAPSAQTVLNGATPAGPGGATSSTGSTGTSSGSPTPAAATISSPH